MKKIAISDRCLGRIPMDEIRVLLRENLSWGEASDSLRDKQKEAEDFIRKNSQSLVEKAKGISRFYKVQGEKNRSHIESLIKSVSDGKSIKPVNPVVDSVVIAELRNALAMAFTIWIAFRGILFWMLLPKERSSRASEIEPSITRSNEVVLRDQQPYGHPILKVLTPPRWLMPARRTRSFWDSSLLKLRGKP